MNAPFLRLFVAVDPPGPVRRAVAAVCGDLPGARWTRAEQLHVTLRFLGSVEDSMLPRIGDALREVVRPAFRLEARDFGVFPSFHAPRVLWTRLVPAAPLEEMHAAIESRLASTGAAPPDDKRFSPHLTLARLERIRGSEVRRWMADHEPFAAGPWTVETFFLYASTLTPSGAVHRKLETYPLGAAPPE
ncbi:MAG TPA: RNA 2',3'-cyclic phosphodiesterase [Thermoanaerobaculia bacterium]|nr:RNA 2',3'-cyclic phosphodiesterase [Thermoanaerobaculia bacterium]